ncbi:MAG: hypothetical protein EOM73_14565, partial [Bacteroidia bacterium]|nr:hypothetical protein [Bacteroidia bacterium]
MGNKEVLWISDTNQYVITEKITANILKELLCCLKPEDIAPKIAHENDITEKEARDLIQHIQGMWSGSMARQKSDISFLKQEYEPGARVFSKKKYEINTVLFEVEYESPEAEWYNHPKFAHLETGTKADPEHFFRVGDSEGFLTIWVNGKHEGTWKREENHFLAGRFSMKIIEKIYQKEELEWMGVFHAAGISNRRQSLLFFGDSGSGKSTLSALAMANGLDVLSDDFLPVDNRNGLVHRFPAALSIKKNAYDLVKIRYPEFMEGMEYN